MELHNLSGKTIGQYSLRELYGVGGMGAVYRAYQLNLEREVAFKVVTANLLTDTEYSKRFYREAKLSASLEHSHIVPIYDYGQVGDITFVVMRLLTGGSLSERFNQGNVKPSLTDISDLLGQIASALDYAHSRGIIHRDMKANNVMFDNHGVAYVVDFGIAKMLEEAQESLTASGAIMGTPSHMAPEQWMGDIPSAATDQYAVGVMVYEMLTGSVPFSAGTPYGLMTKHLNEMPRPPHFMRPDLPESVTTVIERALAKDPKKRFPNLTSFSQAFSSAAETLGQSSTQFFTFQIQRKELKPAPAFQPSPASASASSDKIIPDELASSKTTLGDAPSQPDLTHVHTDKGKSRLPLMVGIILILLVLALGAALILPNLNQGDQSPIVLANRQIPVRQGPSTAYESFTTIVADSKVPIIGINQEGTWYQVELENGDTGWVDGRSNFISISGALNEVGMVIVDLPTATFTNTPLPTDTATVTPTLNPTNTATASPTATITSSPTSTLTLTASPTSPPTATTTQDLALSGITPLEGTVSLKGNTILRTGPGIDFQVADVRNSGEYLVRGKVDEAGLDWYLVDIDGRDLWIVSTATSIKLNITGQTGPTDLLSLTEGEVVTGEFSDGQNRVEYILDLNAGDVITIQLLLAEFNGRLELFDEGSVFPLVVSTEEVGLLHIYGYKVPATGSYKLVIRNLLAQGGKYEVLYSKDLDNADDSTIEYNQTMTGQLNDTQLVSYQFEASAGDKINAFAEASYDTYILIRDPQGIVIVQDDDSGGDGNPLIENFEIPLDGTYTLTLGGFEANGDTYTLNLSDGQASSSNELKYGDSLESFLRSGQTTTLSFEGQEGDVISISVESEFDLRLVLATDKTGVLRIDDDSGGNLQPAIVAYSLPADDTYFIRINSFEASDTGPFTITLDSQ